MPRTAQYSQSSRRSRPSSAPAPKSLYTPPPEVELDEAGLLTQARALTFRVHVTKLSLERILPSLSTIEEKRLGAYHSSVAFEKITAIQLMSCEETVAHLSKQNRALVAKVDALAVAKASSEVVPQPTRAELLAIIGSAHGGAPIAIDLPLDLSRMDLTFVAFRGCGFAPGTTLSKSTLEGAELTNADFSRTHLADANLRFTVGENCNLSASDCTAVALSHCRLRNSSLAHARLNGANLMGADLRGSTFRSACLDGATLCFTNLAGCDLRGASLRGCRMGGVLGLSMCNIDNLTDAVLTAADGARAHLGCRPDPSLTVSAPGRACRMSTGCDPLCPLVSPLSLACGVVWQ